MTRNLTRQAGRMGALAIVGIVLLAGCGSSDSGAKDTTTTAAKGGGTSTTAAGAAASELDGKEFTATGVEGYTPVAGSQLTLTFDDGNLSVNGGCNTLFSSYAVTDGKLAWTGTPAGTMMGCPDDLMNQDTWLIKFFTDGATAKLDGDTLTLTSGDVTITLAAVADAPLTGTEWSLESTISKDAVTTSTTPKAGAPTLTIGADGTAKVFTGCNNGSTTVAVTDTTLTFAPMALTRMMCEDASTVEAAVTTVLSGETTYSIEGHTLTITKGDTGLIYTAPAS
ncbi:META domain-containing protein [Aquihabitans sp. McL0605]|uniref:META domain-containing protein n=1 Tax=Aquihabitans sp. McL0605 TaxID=3415671 RepID=UPI003CF643CF